MPNFADKLIRAVQAKKSSICVGLDPRLNKIPQFILNKHVEESGETFKAASDAIIEFNKAIIDAVKDLVPCVKPQIAFYEEFGFPGIYAFQETCAYAKSQGLMVIGDVKRNDIGSTAESYANAYIGKVDLFGKQTEVFSCDSITVTPYLGFDGIKPFIDQCNKFDKGIFILVKTSNPSSGDLQDRVVDNFAPLYEMVGHLVESWGSDEMGESGYSSIGAVVGATYPSQSKKLRKIMPTSIFLVPGYGAQGATAEDIKSCYNDDGLGAVVNSSRGIIFAYEKNAKYGPQGFADAARDAVIDMQKDLGSVGLM